jgi:hypothetical protein
MISYGLVLLLTPAAFFLSRWIQSRLALPLLAAIAGYFPFLLEAQESLLRGFLVLLFWTLVLSILVLRFSIRSTDTMAPLIWRSREYTESMMRWVETGQLPEGRPINVILFHLKQTAIYCVVAALSANFFALVLGAALLNYMNFYVATFIRDSGYKPQVLFVAWNPWSVIRVIGFLYLGVIVSTPALWLLIPVPWRLRFSLLVPGIVCILLDVVLKITMSEAWSKRLKMEIPKVNLN